LDQEVLSVGANEAYFCQMACSLPAVPQVHLLLVLCNVCCVFVVLTPHRGSAASALHAHCGCCLPRVLSSQEAACWCE
jgi:hypothetical protein